MMKLRPEHLNVLDALKMFGGSVSVEMITRAIHMHSYKHPNFYTKRRVYAAMDQLQSIKLVDATYPIDHDVGAPAVYTLTARGLECLNQLHH